MKKDGKYSLVIVDMQYDFYDPNGSMYVPSAKGLLEDMIAYIDSHHADITEVIFTLDWHKPNHCSFKENGGEWPVHCVMFTKGASIPSELIDTCKKYNLPIKIVTKGEEKEEYGAFKYMSLASINMCISNGIQLADDVYTDNDYFAVCGLCGDYCVHATIENLRKFKDIDLLTVEPITLEVAAIPHLIASIDGGKFFYNYADTTNLKLI